MNARPPGTNSGLLWKHPNVQEILEEVSNYINSMFCDIRAIRGSEVACQSFFFE